MKTSALGDGAEMLSDLLTAEEVGRRLRLPLSTVYYLAKAGQLPAVRFGRSWRFPAADIERLRGGVQSHAVLVVDDDAVTRSLVSSGLEPCGCRVWEAESVDEALRFCQHQRFDALFIDLKMPGRDGTELIRELLGAYSLNQMVVITAQPDMSQARDLLELGPITLLRKPLAVAQLIDCLRRILGGRLVGSSSEGGMASRGAEESVGQGNGTVPVRTSLPAPGASTSHRVSQSPK